MFLKHPAWLTLLGLIPVFFFFALRAFRRAVFWRRWFSGRETRRLPRLMSTVLAGAALAALAVALAGPEVVRETVVFDRSAVSILIGVDISTSMLAEDVPPLPAASRAGFAPNRLNLARQIALGITSRLSGEKTGIFVFAEDPVEVVPFTRDYGYCRYVLENLGDTGIAIPGSNLGRAVLEAREMLAAEGPGRATVLILISDGEDTGFDAERLGDALRAGASGMTIFTVGTGGPDEVLIPLRGPAAGPGPAAYYRTDEGAYLKTRRIEEPLEQIAAAAGGGVFPVG